MIGRLAGTLLECSPGRVLMDVSGVGYELHIPLSTFYALAGQGPGARAALSVHTHVREDALVLFGFATAEERATFELLISISGVGPRMALAVLSGIESSELRRAVATGDRARLQKIPGVGKKTAERILLELRDKLGIGDDPAAAVSAGVQAPPVVASGPRADAVSAMTNLGYSTQVAERAVDGALERLGADTTLEALLRGALGQATR